MKKVCIFAGTTEGRNLAELLAYSGIHSIVCVATQYGENVMEESKFITLRQGRMDEDMMKSFLTSDDWYAVVDATHPFATLVSEQIKKIMSDLSVPFFRLQRNTLIDDDMEMAIEYYENASDCAKKLLHTTGNILLTTGSKDLSVYAKEKALRDRLFVRVLPGIESLELCIKEQLSPKQIIAMQGPFSEEMNIAMIHQYHIEHVVSKESGATGGVDEKLNAALRTSAHIHMISNPEKEIGLSYTEVVNQLEKILQTRLDNPAKLQVILAGIGMGNPLEMTVLANKEIETADVIFGAERLIAPYKDRKKVYPYYLAKDIIPVLEQLKEKKEFGKKVVVVFSGDTGFYSGASKLYEELTKIPDIYVKILPGISTISAFSAKVGIPWQDACLYSIHGRENWQEEFLTKIQQESKMYLLLSGKEQIAKIGTLLKQRDNIQIYVASNLSYEGEKIERLTAEECEQYSTDGLLSMLIINQKDNDFSTSLWIKDQEFIRTKVPMTKEEIREISICKLQLYDNAVIYDIGSGTGSVAVQMAKLFHHAKVFAIEEKREAVELIEANIDKFSAVNIEVIETLAPNGLDKLPKPSHAFIGGSKGNLFAILDKLYEKNPHIRVVVNAISLETITQIMELPKRYDLEEFSCVQIQVNTVNELGKYHLLQANNPVMICSFTMR